MDAINLTISERLDLLQGLLAQLVWMDETELQVQLALQDLPALQARLVQMANRVMRAQREVMGLMAPMAQHVLYPEQSGVRSSDVTMEAPQYYSTEHQEQQAEMDGMVSTDKQEPAGPWDRQVLQAEWDLQEWLVVQAHQVVRDKRERMEQMALLVQSGLLDETDSMHHLLHIPLLK